MGTRFNGPLTRVACSQSATAATKVVAAAAADPATLALAQKLIAAVQASAGLTGWNVQTLAADPTVQVLAFTLFLLPWRLSDDMFLSPECMQGLKLQSLAADTTVQDLMSDQHSCADLPHDRFIALRMQWLHHLSLASEIIVRMLKHSTYGQILHLMNAAFP